MDHETREELRYEVAALRQRLWASEQLLAKREKQVSLLEQLVDSQRRELALLKGLNPNKRGAA
jgi:hypothetical protein